MPPLIQEPAPIVVSLPPNATEQEALTFAGQRRINLIWEATQASIAIIVTLALVYVSVVKTVAPELNNAFFLIVGFYFGRSNHSSIGGVGVKIDKAPYVGR